MNHTQPPPKIAATVAFVCTPLLAFASANQQAPQPAQDTRPLLQVSNKNIAMTFWGKLKEDFYFYNNVRTLRGDYFDQNNYVLHQLNLDWLATYETKRHEQPLFDAKVRLTNYVNWQQYGHYLPFSTEDLRTANVTTAPVARSVTVKSLMPLIFVEEAWAKCNLETLWSLLKHHPTTIQAGFFKYQVGRGIALGYRNDLAVDYLGWPSEKHYEKVPQLPPGILLHTQLHKNVTADLYWMKWTSVSTDLEDVLAPTRAQRLDGPGPGRGTNKDRSNYVLKFNYTPQNTFMGALNVEPYLVYTHAPEQSIEFEADASAYLTTLGTMVDCTHGNWNVNVEVAGQFGHQAVHAIDRNIKVLALDASTGIPREVFSHVVYDIAASNAAGDHGPGIERVPVRPLEADIKDKNKPDKQLDYVVNLPEHRNITQQGQLITRINKDTGVAALVADANNYDIYNANTFGNARFRRGYRLNYQGFMALADVSYTFDRWPCKLTSALGYIGGDTYPYNNEGSRTFHGFVPMRSRYIGYLMENFLIFDRLDLPRPLNISNRTLYAYNNLTDLSNLKFIGLGMTWYPCHDRSTSFITTNFWGLWEVAQLKKWNRWGKISDATAEDQVAVERARLGFPGVPREKTVANVSPTGNAGWLSDENASQFLGIEIDVKMFYRFLDHASGYALFSCFLPGQLYHDLEGQPNITTRRIDTQGLSHYDSLGSTPAFAAVVGLNYKF
jgi:hypothetical protein